MYSPFVICLMVPLVLVAANGPQGPGGSLMDRLRRSESAAQVVLPPGGEEPPIPDTDGQTDTQTGTDTDIQTGVTMGDRCPFPPNADGRWPEFCYDVIGDNCECLMDDMVFNMDLCMELHNYKELLDIQFRILMQRDSKKEDLGMSIEEDAEYLSLFNCLATYKQKKSAKKQTATTPEPASN